MVKYQKIGCFVLMIVSLILSLVRTAEVEAQEKSRKQAVYQPQEEDEAVRVHRTPAGFRGGDCNSIPTETITMIVPEDHIGKTISEKPTVLLFMSQDLAYPLEVTFYSRQSGTIFTSRLKNLTQGFMAVTIPQDSPGLKIGELSKFTAMIVCDEKHPSRNLYVQSWIERVPGFISQDSDNLDCTHVDYAALGIWYDALYCAYSELSNQENVSAFGVGNFNSLLQQVNLAELKIDDSEFQTLVEKTQQ